MIRLIAKLDIKPPYVVKPVHFDGLRKIGDPIKIAKDLYNQGIDEIMYIDIVSSLFNSSIDFKTINKTADHLYVPFGVGGGIRDIKHVHKLFENGADKIIINTYALQENPSIINEISHTYGNQSVVINIEAKKIDNNYTCYSDCGRIPSDKNLFDWISEIIDRGAGEIFLQSVDHDGRKKGFDVTLISKVVDKAKIPVIAASGAGSLEHIKDLLHICRPSGIAISSLFHYKLATISDIKKEINRIYE